jgi:Amt family ammonium transporter
MYWSSGRIVAITPAAGFVTIPQSIFIGFISAVISNLAVRAKNKSNLDDTLDVFPCHGLGGISGMLLTGIFAKEVGLFLRTNTYVLVSFTCLVIVSVYTFVGSYILYLSPIRLYRCEYRLRKKTLDSINRNMAKAIN